MRIDAYAQVQQVYGTRKTQKIKGEAKTGTRDQLQISSKGKDIQTAKAAVNDTADIREELVKPLKAAINSGNYEVSADSFARKVIEKYNQTQLGIF